MLVDELLGKCAESSSRMCIILVEFVELSSKIRLVYLSGIRGFLLKKNNTAKLVTVSQKKEFWKWH